MTEILPKLFAALICVVMTCTTTNAASLFVSGMTLLSTKAFTSNQIQQIEKNSFRKQEQYCLALGLYHEARGEPVIGQYAVGATILNRVRSSAYPNTVCGVVFQNQHKKHRCQFSFACDDITTKPSNLKSFNKMQMLANNLLKRGVFREAKFIGQKFQSRVHDMTHYHRHDVSPMWAKKLEQISLLGAHVFFKSERVTKRYTF